MRALIVAIFTFSIICIISTSSYAQSKEKKDDIAQIEATVQNYFEGWLTGDTSLIGSAMHASCNLKNVRDGKFVKFDRSEYLGFFKPRPRRENAAGKILSVDATSIVGSVKCQLMTSERVYTDYFNMMKIDDRWYIVDKVSTSRVRTKEDKL